MASGEGSSDGRQKAEILVYIHNYSFYSQKILMVLHEKAVSFDTQFVNIASGEQYLPWYLKINPLGEVPVLKDGEKIVIDSAKIIDYLEEVSSSRGFTKISPAEEEGAEVVERHNHFHKLIHDLPADIITIGSFYHQDLVGRPKLPFLYPARRHMKKTTERVPDKLRKIAEENAKLAETLKKKADRIERDLAVMKDADEYKKHLDVVDSVLKEVEEQLAKNEGSNKWLLSENFTVADIDLTILLERLNVLGLETRFWGSRPHISAYFTRVRQRESYKKSTPTMGFHLKTFVKAITYMQI